MIILKNKKAGFNYELLDKFSAGISLFGFEVKSLKNKKGSFEGSFISISNTNELGKLSNKKGHFEVFLKNFFIPPFQEKNTPTPYDSYRTRKLLLKKSEIKEIQKKMKSSRLTIIPLAIHQTEKNLLKMEFALARGKRKFDKREDIKKRDDLRSVEREYKRK
jgi:SsrA-binding protein